MPERWPAPWRVGTTTSTILRWVAEESATQVAAANLIWNEAGVPWSRSTARRAAGRCTRVDVYRNADHGNPIDMLFGPILGISSQRGSRHGYGDRGKRKRYRLPSTDCVRRTIGYNRDSANEFNGYDEATGLPLAGNRDVYTAPSATQAGRTTISLRPW